MSPTPNPTRAAGLSLLQDFLPQAGRHYAEKRNYDHGADDRANVSMLSSYIRHRLITEREVVSAVLQHHAFSDAEKFIQEIFWRTYWKGWLEMRPVVWDGYAREVEELLQSATVDYAAACAGTTGIACFDAWVAELKAHGYLHNHARMWFASIWVFTLRLPWQLGADFFYRHLLDGDAASNTLSWRWVAGLQTAGKTYLAQADNIYRFTAGRFKPQPLAHFSGPPAETVIEPKPIMPLPVVPKGPVGLLLTEEDLHPESLQLAGANIMCVGCVHIAHARSPLPTSGAVLAFTEAALEDARSRSELHFGVQAQNVGDVSAKALADWARANGVTAIITAYVPIGPLKSHIKAIALALAREGIHLVEIRREWDANAWPHAKKGFFAFKDKIPELIIA